MKDLHQRVFNACMKFATVRLAGDDARDDLDAIVEEIIEMSHDPVALAWSMNLQAARKELECLEDPEWIEKRKERLRYLIEKLENDR